MTKASRILGIILLSGVTGAVLIDLYLVVTTVFVFRTATVRGLFLWDASNVLGAPAFQKGLGTTVFGCLLHLLVSTVWTALWVLSAASSRFLARHPVVLGLIFGVIVREVMRRVVLPLGAAPPAGGTGSNPWNLVIAHTLFFGLPVALVTSRRLRRIGETGAMP